MVTAELAHCCADRLRLRFPEQRGDSAFFEELRQTFAQVEGVHGVTIRPRTTSVIVEHDPGIEILPRLREARSFELTVRVPLPPLATEARNRFSALDRNLRRRTDGQMDLRSALFIGFAAVSIVQILRGQWAPTALANAWTAMGIARLGNFQDEDTDGDGEDGDDA